MRENEKLKNRFETKGVIFIEKKRIEKKKKDLKSNGHMTVGGLFNQRSYDHWGRIWGGGGGGGLVGWARGPGHGLSNFLKPGSAR